MLKQVLNDPNCNRLNKSNIKGYIGELYVYKLLKNNPHLIVEHLGNQSGYDIKVNDGQIRIDVKTSTLKNEYGFAKEVFYWGWALKSRSKKKISCTHFVLVALDQRYKAIKFYILKSGHVAKFPSSAGQFGSIQNSFIVPKKAIVIRQLKKLAKKDKNIKKLYLNLQKCKKLIQQGIISQARAINLFKALKESA